MAESHVISALKTKRDELRRAIRVYDGRHKKANADLSSINSALRIFGEEADEPPLRRRSLFAARQLPRLIFDALREAPAGLDTCEIVHAVMVANGMDSGDTALRKRVYHSVSNTLLYFAKKKRVAAGGLRNSVRVWRLA